MAESESTEMYLKTIFELEDGLEPVAISRIAERLGVSAVSANEMIKRLGERELVLHTPYKGVQLTEAGRRRSLSVVRRHRLWERFLVDHLNIPWEQSHDLACQLEHATAEAVTEGLAAFLGGPTSCPHGNAIPAVDGTLDEPDTVPLSELELNQGGTVVRIYREETPLLKYLADHGIYPGLRLVVEDVAPYNGPLTIRLNRTAVILGREIAARVLVTPD